MTEHRLALPQRSPTPLIVPCTWIAPWRTAVSALITAHSPSLCVWMPNGWCIDSFIARMMLSTSQGMVPPLVSQSTTVSAPPRIAACSVARA
jgi:hypothetical protein